MRQLFLVVILALLTSCSTELTSYQGTQPAFAFRQFFNGHIKAWGMVTDYSNKLTRRFTTDIQASWQGNILTLDENFHYNDGSKQSRVWRITLDGNNITGQAGDVDGRAQGAIAGSVVNWHYVLNVPINNKNWKFKVDDWLYRIDDQVVINTSTLYKFGLPVGHVTLMMQKRK
ncbi:DUF3833 domain-containing protein [Celerinatantimonas yamalensis]|uniref:DUF3833 domain-containing protein n=1 Tax=Celerinatantimonas yamalensis TaxID=559956 RepID=A0ABW9GB62_9GAMM